VQPPPLRLLSEASQNQRLRRHWPGQVPQAYLDKFSFIAPTDQVGAKRQTYHSMVRFADDAVGNVTAALRAAGMYDDTLIVFSVSVRT